MKSAASAAKETFIPKRISRHALETVPFGKYQGKSFPEIIVRDPDWFFWVLPNLYGKLADEAQELARRARAIKIPPRGGKRLEVEYEFDRERRFCGFESGRCRQPSFPTGH